MSDISVGYEESHNGCVVFQGQQSINVARELFSMLNEYSSGKQPVVSGFLKRTRGKKTAGLVLTDDHKELIRQVNEMLNQ